MDSTRTGFAGLARGDLANLAGTGFAGLAGLASVWLVVRGLDPTSAGVFFAAVAAFTLATGGAKLGTPTGLGYWIARLRARRRPDLIGACLRIGLVPVVASSLVLAVTLWVAAPWLGGMIVAGSAEAGGGGEGQSAGAILRVLAVFLPLVAITDVALSATRGYLRMRPTVTLDKLLRPALQLCTLAALTQLALWTTVPLLAWPVAWVWAYLPVLALAGYAAHTIHYGYLRQVGPVARPPMAQRAELSAQFWRFTAPPALASTLQLALQRLDIVLVAVLAGPIAAAVYTVAGRFVVLGQCANEAIRAAVQPRLAERLGEGDLPAAGALYRAATSWLVLVSWPFYLLIINFAGLYLGLFGETYRAGVAVVMVLASAMLLASGCGMVNLLLAMAGRTNWNLLNVSLALVTMVAVDVALIPRLGALGAAIGLAAAVAINNLLPLAQVAYLLRLHPFGRGTLAAGGLAVGCFAVLPTLLITTGGATVTNTLGALVLGSAGYLAGVYRLRHRLAFPHALTALRARHRLPPPLELTMAEPCRPQSAHVRVGVVGGRDERLLDHPR